MNKPLLTEVYSTCALYGLLLWYTLALFPFFPGLDILPTIVLVLLFWLGTLLAGKLRPLWRWQGAQEGEINLLPRLFAALILVWPMFLAATLLWSLLLCTLLG